MDRRVLRSEPTDEIWKYHGSRVSQEEIWNCSLHITRRGPGICSIPKITNYQTYRKIAPEVHGIPDHLPKPASPETDLTTLLSGDAQVRPFYCKPSTMLLLQKNNVITATLSIFYLFTRQAQKHLYLSDARTSEC